MGYPYPNFCLGAFSGPYCKGAVWVLSGPLYGIFLGGPFRVLWRYLQGSCKGPLKGSMDACFKGSMRDLQSIDTGIHDGICKGSMRDPYSIYGSQRFQNPLSERIYPKRDLQPHNTLNPKFRSLRSELRVVVVCRFKPRGWEGSTGFYNIRA